MNQERPPLSSENVARISDDPERHFEELKIAPIPVEK
jgi:hypothetical protein